MTTQKYTEWSPTPKQRAVLEAAMTPGVDRTITAICEEAGIVRKTLYNWFKKDADFVNAWNTVWETAIYRYMPSVVAGQHKKALQGNTAAARFIAELGGKMIRKVDITSDGEKIRFVGVTEDEV